MRIKDLKPFLKEISDKVPHEALLTVTPGERGQSFNEWELVRQQNQFQFRGASFKSQDFEQTLNNILRRSGMLAMILRSATRQRDTQGNQIMEVWGYQLARDRQHVEMYPISHEDLYEAFTHHHETGESIPPEAEVIYCGPDGKICGWDRV